MPDVSTTLVTAAIAIGLTHTILGPDHYLPFVMLARARRWSWARTLGVTAICGVAHVLSSIILGGIGLALGAAVSRVEALEAVRGDWAAWVLIAFGLAYALWGFRRALRDRKGFEPHTHGACVHVHTHGQRPHAHAHRDELPGSRATFWALLLAFVLGPCEPLIPLFMLPASRGRWDEAVMTAVAFGVTTVVTMVGATALALAGLKQIRLAPLERWAHALAGMVVAGSGMAIVALGL
jgi:nickel/cobalt exporter